MTDEQGYIAEYKCHSRINFDIKTRQMMAHFAFNVCAREGSSMSTFDKNSIELLSSYAVQKVLLYKFE